MSGKFSVKVSGVPKGGTDREVPTVYRHCFQFETFRPLKWKERLKILFGQNIEVVTMVATMHACGKFRPEIAVRLTKLKKPPGGEDAYAGYVGTPIKPTNP
jgi:hypothetical protein